MQKTSMKTTGTALLLSALLAVTAGPFRLYGGPRFFRSVADGTALFPGGER